MTRRGFTLLEMIVALALTGMVVLLAHAIVAGVFALEGGVRRSAAVEGHRAEGRAWALEACHGVEVGATGDLGFIGSITEAAFTARVIGAEGVVASVPVHLRMTGNEVELEIAGRRFPVVDSAVNGQINYLGGLGGDEGWLSGWNSPVSAPQAVRVTWSLGGVADTLLCPIGVRG